MIGTRGQATTQTQTTRPAAAGRAGSIHLVLALLLALGATLAGAAPAVAQDAASLRLTPTRTQIDVNRPIRITAHALDADNQPIEGANQKTSLSFEPEEGCGQDAGATAIVVVCQKPGTYTIVGVIGHPRVQSEPVTLEVVADPVPPRISSVRPRSSPPSREVVVTGTTGSCSQSGTLTLEGLAVAPEPVTGVFSFSFNVLPGTFPGRYPLELSVECDRQTQLDRAHLRVRNRAPTAADDAETLLGPEVRIDVTANDRDPDGDDGYRTVVEAGQPLHGTAEVQGQAIVYRPGPGFVDGDQFGYRNCDVVDATGRKRDCDRAIVTVTEGPVPVDDPDVVTVEGRQVDIDVMKNDHHPDAKRLRVKPRPVPKGTVTVQSDGTVRYIPKTGDTGKDSFQYDYCGSVINLASRADCPSATVTVDVQPRVPPAIKAITPNPTPPNKEVTVTGTTGSCQEGTLILRIPSPGQDVPAAVTASAGGSFTAALKVPGGTFVGSYTLELRVDCDHQVQTTEAKLEVRNQPPDAVDDRARTTRGTPVTIDVTGNDTDPDGDDGYKTSLEVTQPANGRTEVLSGDQVRYTPNAAFTGVDPFTYTFCDIVDANGKRDCDSATVTVTVRRPLEDPRIDSVAPEAPPPNREVTVEGTTGTCDKAARLTLASAPDAVPPVSVTGGQDGGFEAKLEIPPGTFVGPYKLRLHAVCEGKPKVVERELRVGNQPPKAADDTADTSLDTPVTIDVTRNDVDPDGDDGYRTSLDPGGPGHGTAVEQQPGDRIRYRPEAGFTGVDRFTYRFCDIVDANGKKDCGSATVTVTVGKPPPEAVDDAATTAREQPVTIRVGANDKHPDPALLHVSRPPTAPATAVEQRQPPGSILYTPAKGFTGTETFQYDYCPVVANAAGRAACAPATVTVTVEKPTPVPVDDPDVTTQRDQPVVVEVMKNDRDPDPARLQVGPPGRPGAKTAEQPDGTVRYTPEAGFTGTDTFTYDYCDGSVGATTARGACASATVTMNVNDTDVPPVISSVKPASTSPGKAVKVTGGTGSCGRAGTLALQGTGVAVTVAAGQDGAFTTSLTVPAGTLPGPYTLELGVDCKGQPQRAEAQLTVTNQAPVAADDTARTARDQAKEIPVTDNDRDPDDPDGYRTLLLVTRQPDHGTAEPQPDLTVVYTPQRGFVGTDRFTYSLCDDMLNAAGRADCGDATVTVTVRGTGTAVAPVISSVDPGSTSPGKPVEVAGTTGSCGRAGTLTLSGAAGLRMGVAGDQDGRFAVTVTVPDGTFPGPYKLALDVDCKGQVQRAEADLTVTNQAPVAADDQATTTPDTATTIEVTGNDRDPDDPDTYPTIVVVTGPPDQGTAEARPDLSIVYTPGPGFVGTDRFTYSLCDDVLNATGQADCGTATVTVRVDPIACASSAGDISSLRVEPGRGQGGTRVRITAAVDPRLATCQLRLLLGGTPLAPDVTVGDDGSISAERAVPPGLKTGRNPMQLATMTAATLAETPFEVLGSPPPPRPLLPPWLVRLLLSAGVVAAGFLARAAFGKWGKSAGDRDKQRGRSVERPDDLRAEPHTSPVEVAVEPVPDNTRTLAVRLEPHPDPGIQTVQTLKEVTP